MNYKKSFFHFIILLFLHNLAFGQEKDPVAYTDTTKSKYLPTVGIGPGIMVFYGDVGYKNYTDPIRFKLGLGVSVEEKLFDHFSFSYEFIYGQLYGNDKSISRHNNFQADIISNALTFNYYPLNPSRVLRPYISLGLGGLYYSTSIDKKDANGITYNYWSDNTIRDKAEMPANVTSSVILGRDYTYETSAGSGFALSIPFGFGVNFKITNKLSMNVGPTMYYTMTENIDNISSSKSSPFTNDRFLYASFSLRYDFKAPKYKNPSDANYENVNFLALDNQDTDGDGVVDSKDKCAKTPVGEKVDPNGCPMDDDKDGVPNFMDKELNTRAGATVDELGIEITEEYLAKKEAERIAKDSLGLVRKEVRLPDPGTPVSFVVQLGAYKNGIPPELVDKFLAIPDVKNKLGSDSLTSYSVGPFTDIKVAEEKKNELVAKGIKDATLIGYDQDGREVELERYLASNQGFEIVDNTAKVDTASSSTSSNPTTPAASAKKGIEFKVQLGAFTKSINEDAFKGIQNVSKETMPNGSTRYFAGSFSSLSQANAYRDKVRKNGFETAFTVAYKDGKRVENPYSARIEEGDEVTGKGEPVFKVQLGAFKSEIDPEKLKGIENVTTEKSDNGLIRYLAGSFGSVEEAFAMKEKIKQNEDFKGAYVVAYKGNKQVKLSQTIPARVHEEVIKSANAPKTNINKDNLVFKVQLGVFKNEVPTDILSVYLTLKDVTHETTPDGLTRFMAGSFKDIDAAKAYQKEVEAKGVKKPFVIAFDGNKQVPLLEAIDALK